MKSSILLLIATLGASSAALAQSSEATPNFDLLKAAHGADSLRRIAAKQHADLVRLGRIAEAKSDTIARQRRELESLRTMRAPHDEPAGPRVPVADSTPATIAGARVLPPVAAPAIALTAVASSRPVSPEQQQSLPPQAAPPVAATPRASTTAAPVAPLPTTPVLSGLVQFWLTAGDGSFHNTFRLRRAEVKASGIASPNVSWVVMLDLGKALSATSVTTSNGSLQTTVAQGSRALQDALISVQASPAIRVDAGQQKLPFGLEGSQSSATLETVERALFASDRARGGSFGDVRDLGVSVRGKWSSVLDYQAGTFNGSGESQNDVDANSAKAVVGRVVVHPWPSLQLGASGIYAGTSAADAPRRDRDGLDVRFRSNKILIQAEAVAGHDGALARHGMYAHAGYHVQPMLDLHVRFDAWDPDLAREADAASATERDYLTGATWTLQGTGLKAQADLVRRTWSAELTPNRWQLLMNLQTSW